MDTNHTTNRLTAIRASLPTVAPAPDAWTADTATYAHLVSHDVDLLPGERFARGVDRDDAQATVVKVNRLAARCARHNLPAPTCATQINADGTFDVLITGLGVKLPGGWRVIAVVDHATDGLATVAPGAPEGTFARWTGAESNCDDCGKAIRRVQTVVVADEHGNERQLGGQCATAFLGMTVHIAFTLVNDMADDDWFDEAGDGGGRQTVHPQHAVSVAVAVAGTFGWRSKGKANNEGGVATADLVEAFLFGRHQQDAELRKEVNASYKRSDESHAAYMTGLMEWAATAGGSDYLDTIRVMLTERDVVAVRRLGVLASVPAAYDRAVAERLAAENATEVAPVPVTDARVKVTGVVQTIKPQETEYGMTWKMLVTADEGYRLWGTVPSSIDPQAGDRVSFMARVTPSRDDATFGFYSRPTKPELLAVG